MKICDPWALLHTYGLGLMCRWGCPIPNGPFMFWAQKVHVFHSCNSLDKKFLFCTGSHGGSHGPHLMINVIMKHWRSKINVTNATAQVQLKTFKKIRVKSSLGLFETDTDSHIRSITRMHSSRMRTDRGSSHLGSRGCLVRGHVSSLTGGVSGQR